MTEVMRNSAGSPRNWPWYSSTGVGPFPDRSTNYPPRGAQGRARVRWVSLHRRQRRVPPAGDARTRSCDRIRATDLAMMGFSATMSTVTVMAAGDTRLSVHRSLDGATGKTATLALPVT